MTKHLLALYLTGGMEIGIGLFLPTLPKLLLIYLGTITLLIALSTQSGRHGILGKRADGQHPWWSTLIFFNWHLLYRFIATRRLHPSDPRFVEVQGGWYVAAWPRVEDKLEPCVVIDLAAELPLQIKPQAYHSCPTLDRGTPSVRDLESLVQFASAHRDLDTKTVVHCAQGYGRSVMALAAILVRCEQFPTWRDALTEIQKKRPHARLSQCQIDTLERWTQDYRSLDTPGAPHVSSSR
jgi:hypothetical protein